jgi:hypothetical protein
MTPWRERSTSAGYSPEAPAPPPARWTGLAPGGGPVVDRPPGSLLRRGAGRPLEPPGELPHPLPERGSSDGAPPDPPDASGNPGPDGRPGRGRFRPGGGHPSPESDGGRRGDRGGASGPAPSGDLSPHRGWFPGGGRGVPPRGRRAPGPGAPGRLVSFFRTRRRGRDRGGRQGVGLVPRRPEVGCPVPLGCTPPPGGVAPCGGVGRPGASGPAGSGALSDGSPLQPPAESSS